MNIPIAVFCIVMILVTLHVPTPPGSVSEKLRTIDWGYANSLFYYHVVAVKRINHTGLVETLSLSLALRHVALA